MKFNGAVTACALQFSNSLRHHAALAARQDTVGGYGQIPASCATECNAMATTVTDNVDFCDSAITSDIMTCIQSFCTTEFFAAGPACTTCLSNDSAASSQATGKEIQVLLTELSSACSVAGLPVSSSAVNSATANSATESTPLVTTVPESASVSLSGNGNGGVVSSTNAAASTSATPQGTVGGSGGSISNGTNANNAKSSSAAPAASSSAHAATSSAFEKTVSLGFVAAGLVACALL